MTIKRKRPETSLTDLLVGSPPQDSDTSRKGIDKRVTTLRLANVEEKEASTGGLISPSLFVPSEEQLAKINKFTLRSVGADEVACFTTHSCNDLLDRDDDRFRTSAVKGFAELPYPYSPIGKSYMVGHDYTKLAVGRIFDAANSRIKVADPDSGQEVTATFLDNDVYIPRTVANEQFIENLEFGINWAVSVGVMLGKSACTIGKEHDWGFWWFCSEGHEKGLYYDPDSDEEDDWGWPVPVSESDAKAVKCTRDLDDAKDMYELSQVFLGAQYFAEVSKAAGIEAIVKSANTKHISVIGLRHDEGSKVPTPKMPAAVVKAARSHKLREEDGRFQWKDEQNLVWSFTPGEDTSPLCFGRAADTSSRVSEIKAKRDAVKAKLADLADAIAKDTSGAAVIAVQLEGTLSALDGAIEADNDDDCDKLIDTAQDQIKQLIEELGEAEGAEDDDTEESKAAKLAKGHSHSHNHPTTDTTHSHFHNHTDAVGYNHDASDTDVTHSHAHEDKSAHPEGDEMSKKAVLAVMTKMSLPRSIVEKVTAAPEEGQEAFVMLMGEVSQHIAELTPKAAAGEAYVKELRADVLDMYAKSKTIPGGGSPVDVEKIERLLDRVGDDPETLSTLRDEYEAAFRAKFPQAVRRSTVEQDHNTPTPAPNMPDEGNKKDADERVRRIHG